MAAACCRSARSASFRRKGAQAKQVCSSPWRCQWQLDVLGLATFAWMRRLGVDAFCSLWGRRTRRRSTVVYTQRPKRWVSMARAAKKPLASALGKMDPLVLGKTDPPSDRVRDRWSRGDERRGGCGADSAARLGAPSVPLEGVAECVDAFEDVDGAVAQRRWGADPVRSLVVGQLWVHGDEGAQRELGVVVEGVEDRELWVLCELGGSGKLVPRHGQLCGSRSDLPVM